MVFERGVHIERARQLLDQFCKPGKGFGDGYLNRFASAA